MDSTRPASPHPRGGIRLRLLFAGIAVVAATPLQAQALYRCTGGDAVTAWQDAPCPEGAEESVRAFDPALAGTPEQAARLAEQRARAAEAREQLRAAAARASRPRAARGRSHDRSNAACEQARHLARLRSDASGHRIPARTIRTRERQAHEACRRR